MSQRHLNMSSDLNDVNTVQDLLNLQENAPASDLIEQIVSDDPSDALDICRNILFSLKDLHTKVAQIMIKEGKPNLATTWNEDATRFDMALTIIEDVQL